METTSNEKVFKLKVGELTRVDTDTSHFYFLDGDFLPSVSTILDQACPVEFGLKMFWQNNTKQEADKIFEDAGELGSKMHNAFELLLNGEELNVLRDFPTEREKKILVSFVDWFKTFHPSNFIPEQSIASKTFQYAGTLDLVADIDGEKWLIDFKTTSGIRFSHRLQVLAYKQAYEESFDVKIDKVGIARFGTINRGRGTKLKNKWTGNGWEFEEVVGMSIDNFMDIYKTFLTLNGGVIPQPKEITVYPEFIRLLERIN